MSDEKALQRPILDRVRDALDENGCLPDDFQLEGPLEEGQIGFAPGAMDGIIMYHSGGGANKQLLAKLQDVTTQVAAGLDFDEAEARLAAVFAERANSQAKPERRLVSNYDEMLVCIDGLHEWILANKEQIDPNTMMDFALRLLHTTSSVGAVKYALSLLELLSETTGAWRGLVRDLSACDEFTLYGVFVARNWENASDELWQMAKRVDGWGRVHAVAELEPENQKMREWLLDDGWRNRVMPAYSALQCAVKGGLAGRLKQQELTDGQFEAATGLLAGLLDEGPVAGISRIDEPDGLLTAYLEHAGRHNLGDDDRRLLADIAGLAEACGWQQVQELAQALLKDNRKLENK